MRSYKEEIICLNAKAATGEGTAILVEDYQLAIVTINSASSANLTVKCAGAISETAPDFTAAQSTTVRYDYIALMDLEDTSTIDGDTGLVLTGTDDHRLFKVNVDGLKWLNFVVTARSAGNVSVRVKLFTP